MPQISINGKTMETTHHTLGLILNEMSLNQGRFAVEVDGQLIPKPQHDAFILQDGMVIEVVNAVGGG